MKTHDHGAGRGLEPLPRAIYTHCVHGTLLTEFECKQCTHEVKHPRARAKSVAAPVAAGWPV